MIRGSVSIRTASSECCLGSVLGSGLGVGSHGRSSARAGPQASAVWRLQRGRPRRRTGAAAAACGPSGAGRGGGDGGAGSGQAGAAPCAGPVRGRGPAARPLDSAFKIDPYETHMRSILDLKLDEVKHQPPWTSSRAPPRTAESPAQALPRRWQTRRRPPPRSRHWSSGSRSASSTRSACRR